MRTRSFCTFGGDYTEPSEIQIFTIHLLSFEKYTEVSEVLRK